MKSLVQYPPYYHKILFFSHSLKHSFKSVLTNLRMIFYSSDDINVIYIFLWIFFHECCKKKNNVFGLCRFDIEDYKAVLYQCPSPEFVHAIFPDVQRSVLPLGVLVTTLLKTDAFDIGLKIVKDLHHKGQGTQRVLCQVSVKYSSLTSSKVF